MPAVNPLSQPVSRSKPVSRSNRLMRARRWPDVRVALTVSLMLWAGSSHAPDTPSVSWSPYTTHNGLMDPAITLPASTAAVLIEAPANGSTLQACRTVTIAVTLKDPAARAARVDFYVDADFLGSLAPPDAVAGGWTMTWEPAAGMHRLRAVVLERSGAWAVSSPVLVNVSMATRPAADTGAARSSRCGPAGPLMLA